MDDPSWHSKLRDVKRRRIELTSQRAALDLEDLNLEYEQSRLEGLLYTRTRITPTWTSPAYNDHPHLNVVHGFNDQTEQRPAQSPFSPPTTSERNADGGVVTGSESSIKKERSQEPNCQRVVIVIDDNEEETDTKHENTTETHVGQLGPFQSPSSEVVDNGRSGSTTLQDSSGSNTEKQRDVSFSAAPQTSSPSPKQTRIVVLKYKASPAPQTRQTPPGQNISTDTGMQDTDPRSDSRRLPPQNQTCVQVSRNTRQNSKRKWSLSELPPPITPTDSRSKRPKNPPTAKHKSSLQPNSTRRNRSPSPSESTTSSTSSLASFLAGNESPQPSTCPCESRDPECRACRGTPAVLAEASSLMLPDSRRRTLQQRAAHLRALATTYPIPPLVEQSDTEVKDLEIRFCRRVVDRLVRLRDILYPARRQVWLDGNINNNGRPRGFFDVSVPTLRRDIACGWDRCDWVSRIRDREHYFKALVDDIEALFTRRTMAREDEDGVWNGRITVLPCKSAEEFEGAVGGVVARLLRDHPDRCCLRARRLLRFPQSMEVGCWVDGFRGWVGDQMKACRECIELCASAVNEVDRRKIVDDWEIG